MGLPKLSKRSSSGGSQSSAKEQRPKLLTMGISPAASVMTWRLAESQKFDVFTYWPVETVEFQSEVFGNQTFHTNHFSLSEPSKMQFAAVLLVIPTIKDVSRMCKKLKPFLSSSTLVFVDVSGGLAPVQRLVKGNLGSNFQVSGLISDVDAEFASRTQQVFQIKHRQQSLVPPAATTASKSLITIEPCNSLLKTILSIEEALQSTNLSVTHLKSSQMFNEFQWNRCITTIVFELLTVVLDTPNPNDIAQNVVAKPLVEGLISELYVVASACGTTTGLPSKSQMMANGSRLARLAPADFFEPSFSRTYYKVFNKMPISLDFLVLLPILLSDELPKGGLTPYLECIYAFTSRLLQLNAGEYKSNLFERIGEGSGGSGSNKQIEHLLQTEQLRSQELTAQLQQRVAEVEQLRQRPDLTEELKQRDIVIQQLQQRPDLTEQLRQRDLEIQRLRQQPDLTEQLRQRDLEIQQLRQRGPAPDELKSKDQEIFQLKQQLQRSPNLNEQMEKLRLREQEIMQREEKLRKDLATQQKSATLSPPAQAISPSSPSVTTAQAPSTPGGTTYSRFDPKAPVPQQHQQIQQPQQPQFAQQYQQQQYQQQQYQPQQYQQQQQQPYLLPQQMPQQMNPQMPQQLQQYPMESDPYASQDVSYASIDSRSSRASVQYGSGTSPGGSRSGLNAGYGGPSSQQQQYRRRQSRRASLGDESDLMSISSRRRQSSTTQSALFSQNFQLDGVMNSATDRYHFVSRGRGKQRDPKLSSDEDAYHQARKYIHGGGSGPYPSGPDVSSSASSTRRKSNFNPAQVSSSRTATPVMKNSISSPTMPLPDSLGQGFNFGGTNEYIDPLDATHQMPVSLDPAARGDAYGSFPGSNNSSSMESNHASERSETRTPPTPQGSLDPMRKHNIEDDEKKAWGKRLFRMN